jgi:hypothetical protein
VKVGTRVSTLTLLSKDHLGGALYFAESAALIEQSEAGTQRLAEHRAFVIGAVLCSVGFLEAKINELFHFAEDSLFLRGSGIPPRTARHLTQARKVARLDRLPVDRKYQAALLLTGKAPLDEGREPLQSAVLLVDLRNALVHFRPAWSVIEEHRTSEEELSALARGLKGRFPLNPLLSRREVFFPDLCPSYGCAAWAVTSAFSFAETALLRIGLRRTGLEPFSEKLPYIPRGT